ncbi:sensor histidine kinase [Geminisphaera colitermitum]|uniref:sensor histidine kinase n=1 Tax=Geminisphaera colitermitum TaxID=1148786 RepID=UPI000158D00D|nr:ATP-binding protein [Geminisphaera colitermitum]
MPNRGLRPSLPPSTPGGILCGFLVSLAVTFACVWLSIYVSRNAFTGGGPSWAIVFWPETGCSIALLLIYGLRQCPAIYLGHVLALICFYPLSLHPAIGIESTLHAMLSAWIIRRIFPGWTILPNVRFDIVLVGLAGALVSLPFALFNCWKWGAVLPATDHFWQKVLIWWLGETTSVVAFTPLILMLFMPEVRSERRRPLEYLFYIAILLTGACLACISTRQGETPAPGALLMVTACVLIGLRNGTAAGVISNCLFYVIIGLAYILCAPIEDAVLTTNQVIFGHCLLLNLMVTTLLVASGNFSHRRAERELRGVSTRVLNAQEAERRRLSRDLHDSVCQTMQAIVLQMKLLGHTSAPLDFEKHIQPRITDLDKAVAELRQNIDGLRPELLDRSNFADVVREYATAFARRHHVEVTVYACDELPTLPVPNREHLFRVLQESLANAVNHGGARHVQVSLHRDAASAFVLSVRDNGCGFDETSRQRTSRPRYGLRTMQERAFLMGGELAIESTPGAGTHITLKIPALPPPPMPELRHA